TKTEDSRAWEISDIPACPRFPCQNAFSSFPRYGKPVGGLPEKHSLFPPEAMHGQSPAADFLHIQWFFRGFAARTAQRIKWCSPIFLWGNKYRPKQAGHLAKR